MLVGIHTKHKRLIHEHLQSMANRKTFNSKYDQLDLFSFYLEVTFHSMITKGMQSLHQCNQKENKDMYSEEFTKEKLRKKTNSFKIRFLK